MSREDYVAIAARLFAIYVLFITIRAIPGSLSALSQPDGGSWLWLYAAFTVVVLSFAAFLWFFPLTVARKLLPVMREPRSESSVSSATALSIGITLIGLWFLASAVTDASYWLILLIRVAQTDATGFEWTPDQIAGMGATAVEIAIALCLILGSSGIKRLIARYRYGDAADAR